MPKTGKQYLVVGVGFLGRRIVKYLLERGETRVRCFDIAPSNPFEGDVSSICKKKTFCESGAQFTLREEDVDNLPCKVAAAAAHSQRHARHAVAVSSTAR